MSLLSRYTHLPSEEKKLFLEALWFSGVARFLVLFIPFRWYRRWLGKAFSESENTEIKPLFSIKVKRAIQRSAKYSPWRNKCLEQAIAAKKIYDKRKITSTIYFGLRRVEGKMQAHAWLRCGNIIVTGSGQLETYTIVSYFT